MYNGIMFSWKTWSFGVLLWVLAIAPVYPNASYDRLKRTPVRTDTVRQRTSSKDIRSGRRMSTSAYPVRIEVTGRAVKVDSDHVQLLPIYTRGGVLKMTIRLNKGTNWLTGIPRGNYFINNRPVAVK